MQQLPVGHREQKSRRMASNRLSIRAKIPKLRPCRNLPQNRRRHTRHRLRQPPPKLPARGTTSSWSMGPPTSSAPITRCRRWNRKSDGLQVNAVLGFCNMLWKLLREGRPEEIIRPTHLAIIFDKSEITFRNKIYPDYKAHRPPAPDDLHSAVSPSSARRCARSTCPAWNRLGFEADDLIATYVGTPASAGDRDHRVVRQGPDAARHRLRHHVRRDEGSPDRHRGSDREVRRAAGEGGRGAGAGRRFPPTTSRACPASASRPRRN